MKKPFLRFLIIFILCALLPFSAAAAPCLTVLNVSRGDGTVALTCFLAQPQSGQELTCTLQDPQGNLLQVAQEAASGGVNTLSLAVSDSSAVVARLGGDGIVTPRKIAVLDGYRTRFLFIPQGLSVAQWQAQGQIVQVTRGEQPLNSEEIVVQGDVLHLDLGEETPTPLTAVLAGDVNGDGKIAANDALQVLKQVVGKETLTDAAFFAADFSQSGTLGAQNALQILKVIVGKIPAL